MHRSYLAIAYGDKPVAGCADSLLILRVSSTGASNQLLVQYSAVQTALGAAVVGSLFRAIAMSMNSTVVYFSTGQDASYHCNIIAFNTKTASYSLVANKAQDAYAFFSSITSILVSADD